MDVSTELFIKICQPVIMDGKDFLFLLTTVYVVEQHSVVKGFLEHMPEITQYTFYMAIHALAFVIFCHQDFKTRLQTFYIIATIWNVHMENTKYVQSLMHQSVATSTSLTCGEA